MAAKCTTWIRDSHGLFDYESRSVVKNSIKLDSAALLTRVGNDVKIASETSEPQSVENTKLLLKIEYCEGEGYAGVYSLCPVEICQKTPLQEALEQESIWLVGRGLKSQSGIKGYHLAEGDILKLGRVKYRVIELNSEKNYKPEEVNLAELIKGLDSIDSPVEEGLSSKFSCRICLSELYTAENPLISPCNCDGTVKYLHVRCLQHWLKSKLVSKATENSISITWKALCCELCKKSFPSKLVSGGKCIDLVDIPKPRANYIILEALSSERNKNKGIHVLSLASKSLIKIGRGHESDMRISDISVSRLHAVVKLVNGHFFLEDQNSKFGTLIEIKRPIVIDNNTLSIQAGRSYIMLNVKKPFSFFPACFKLNSPTNQLNLEKPRVGDMSILPYNCGLPLSVDGPSIFNRPIHKRTKYANLLGQVLHSSNSSNEDEEDASDDKIEVPNIFIGHAVSGDILRETGAYPHNI